MPSASARRVCVCLCSFRPRSFQRWELALLAAFLFASALRPIRVAAIAVAAIAAAALALGDLLTRPMKFEAADAPAAWTAGFGILILLLALLGRLGLLSLPWITGLLLVLLVRAGFVRKRLWHWVRFPFERWTVNGASSAPLSRLCIFFLFLFAGCSLLLMLTPVTAFDVLAYHFPLARLYSETHFIRPAAAILQSYYPQGAETLMALGYVLGGPETAQMLMPFLGILFLWLVVRLGRCCGLGPTACFAGAAIAATFPFLHWTLSVPKDDAALALFQLGALYCFLQWQAGRGYRWILLGSFFLGQTAGIKHVALFGLVAIAPLWIWCWRHENRKLRVIALSILLFAASGLFWHLQTFLLTGNPVYPEGPQRAAHSPVQEHSATLADYARRYATIPWYLQFQGNKAFESPTANPLGMFLFLFLPALFATLLKAKWTAPRKACLLFISLYLFYWASVNSTLRYAIVPFALIALATGAALARLLATGSKWPRRLVLLGGAYGFLFALLTVMTFEVNRLQLLYVTKRISAREYLAQALPTTGGLFRLAAQHPNASVFGVGNCSRLYAPDPMRFGCALCSEHCRPEEVAAHLENGAFQFIILPNSPDYRTLTDLLTARFGAAAIDRDDRFVTLALGRKR